VYWSGLAAVLRAFRSFPGIFALWHTELVSHTHYVDISHGLEISRRTKNNLGEPALLLFFHSINELSNNRDIADWKQHFLA
jgi:hypothetical protein